MQVIVSEREFAHEFAHEFARKLVCACVRACSRVYVNASVGVCVCLGVCAPIIIARVWMSGLVCPYHYVPREAHADASGVCAGVKAHTTTTARGLVACMPNTAVCGMFMMGVPAPVGSNHGHSAVRSVTDGRTPKRTAASIDRLSCTSASWLASASVCCGRRCRLVPHCGTRAPCAESRRQCGQPKPGRTHHRAKHPTVSDRERAACHILQHASAVTHASYRPVQSAYPASTLPASHRTHSTMRARMRAKSVRVGAPDRDGCTALHNQRRSNGGCAVSVAVSPDIHSASFEALALSPSAAMPFSTSANDLCTAL